MEDYVAADKRPLDKCLEDVRNCDAYIGIFAWRYGFIPKGCDKSITHLEYEEAGKSGIPRLIFLLHEEASKPIKYMSNGAERQKIEQFRNELQNDHTVGFFTNADQLGGLVSAAVSQLKFSPPPVFKTVKPPEIKPRKPGEKPIPEYVIEDGKEKRNEPEALPSEVKNIVSKAIKVEKNKDGFWEAYYQEGIIMAYIPPGEFIMGSKDGEACERPPHLVFLDGYWMGKVEVTVKQYLQFVKDAKSHYPKWLEKGSKYNIETGNDDYYKKFVSDENCPIVGISWDDAKAYCDWLSNKTGLNFKLPTEAQWEMAARGKDGRQYPWGGYEPDETLANFGSEIGKTTPVGSYPKGASPYGLLDMAGNVWESCSDWYDQNYYNISPLENPPGPNNNKAVNRVSRGGSWSNNARDVRCTKRISHNPPYRSEFVGFRLCLEME